MIDQGFDEQCSNDERCRCPECREQQRLAERDSYGNDKVDRVIAMCLDFTESDFADLAVTASDQAMLDVSSQLSLRKAIATSQKIVAERAARIRKAAS